MEFKKAQRQKAKLRLALMGTSGAGKTYSALLIAQGIGGKIAMVDTEQGSGELYSNLCDYDVCSIKPPFEPQKYIDAIKSAEKAKYDVVIIDSLSHAWAGEGGLLDMHDKATTASKSKNSYVAWREITPVHNRLVETILTTSLHVIATLRCKTEYSIQDTDGKKQPVKIGLAPVFRDGIEYEFTLCFEMSVDSHIATATKDRTSLFDGKHFVPNIATGETIKAWLTAGVELVAPPAEQPKPEPSPSPEARLTKIREALIEKFSSDVTEIKSFCSQAIGRDCPSSDWTHDEQIKIIDALALSEVKQ